MKTTLLLIAAVITCLGQCFAADTPMDISLVDGSKLKGRVMSSTAAEVTVMTDFGVVRLPLDKLSPESRQAVTVGSKPDTEALLRRIAELEAKVQQLQQENETLRRQVVSAPTPTYRPPSGSNSFTPSSTTPQPPSSGVSHVISSTGKRHNSGCRFFGSGRPCGPTDGVACKICGG